MEAQRTNNIDRVISLLLRGERTLTINDDEANQIYLALLERQESLRLEKIAAKIRALELAGVSLIEGSQVKQPQLKSKRSLNRNFPDVPDAERPFAPGELSLYNRASSPNIPDNI